MQITNPAPQPKPRLTATPCPVCAGTGFVETVVCRWRDPEFGTVADVSVDTCPACGPVPANDDTEGRAIPADLSDVDLPF